MTKLDEVARAIGQILPYDGGSTDLMGAARAAVEAMREPTNEVLTVGDGYAYDMSGIYCADVIWQAMIDAILNEKPE